MSGKKLWKVLKDTVSEFSEDKCMRLAAALAYYTVFSVTPLILICIAIASKVLQSPNVADKVQHQIVDVVGPQAGQAIGDMLRAYNSSPQHQHASTLAAIVGFITLLVGTSSVFGQLQDALNTIWEVTPKPGRGIKGIIEDRVLSLSLVFGVCFLLLVSLVVSTMLTAISGFISSHLGHATFLVFVTNWLLSLVIIAALFAMLFKALPDAHMDWRDVWIGAIVTSVLFNVGKAALSIYLGRQSVQSPYGAAGSFVVLLLWIYYSSVIFLVGAQFTHVYTMEVGSKAVPTPNAVPLTEEQRNEQGIPRQAAVEAAAKGQGSVAEQTGVAPVTSSTRTGPSERGLEKRRKREQQAKSGGSGFALAAVAFVSAWLLASRRSKVKYKVVDPAKRRLSTMRKLQTNVFKMVFDATRRGMTT